LKKTTWMAWLLIFTAAIFIGGCSSDDDSPSGPSGDNPPEFGGTDLTVTVPVGMQNSQDPMAQLAMGYILTANSISNMGIWFQQPGGLRAADGPPWEYDWTQDGLTVTVIVDETSTQYTWDVYFDGSLEGYIFDNVLIYSAWEDKDGGCGGLDFYAWDEVMGEMSWEWCTTGGVFTMTMWTENTYGSSEINVTVNADGSGEMEVYVDEALYLLINWDSAGNGQWWTYDPDDNGSWDAAAN